VSFFIGSSDQTSSFKGKTATGTHEELENVNGNKVLSYMDVTELFKTFRKGCEGLVNNPHSKQQSSAQNPGTATKVPEMLTKNC
jgi:hypothetical protein